MLRKPERLARERDIARVHRARPTRNADFTVRIVPNGGRTSRATVVVAKTVSKKAVERNLLKRRVRAIITKPLRAMQPAADVLISIKPAARGKSFAVLQQSLLSLLKR